MCIKSFYAFKIQIYVFTSFFVASVHVYTVAPQVQVLKVRFLEARYILKCGFPRRPWVPRHESGWAATLTSYYV